jgi:hypothetical protein
MGGAWLVAVGGITAAKLAGKAVPRVAFVPLTIFSTVFAYQVDAAYGTKMERVNAEFDRIVANEQHWFLPLDKEALKKTK